MRVQETNEETEGEIWVWKESRAVHLTFMTEELPTHVYFCYMKIEVYTFVAEVCQCYKCGKFSHIAKFCTKENYASHAKKQNMKRPVLKNV
jgi:hypothetical protein